MLGHSLKETERSASHVIVSETATSGAVAIFGVLAILSTFLYMGIAGLAATAFFAAWALYAAVASEFTADRGHGQLVVRRRLGPWSVSKTYCADSIVRVYVRRTIKGNGLALRLKSGRSKGLTMSLDSQGRFDHLAGVLNHFLHSSR